VIKLKASGSSTDSNNFTGCANKLNSGESNFYFTLQGSNYLCSNFKQFKLQVTHKVFIYIDNDTIRILSRMVMIIVKLNYVVLLVE